MLGIWYLHLSTFRRVRLVTLVFRIPLTWLLALSVAADIEGARTTSTARTTSHTSIEFGFAKLSQYDGHSGAFLGKFGLHIRASRYPTQTTSQSQQTSTLCSLDARWAESWHLETRRKVYEKKGGCRALSLVQLAENGVGNAFQSTLEKPIEVSNNKLASSLSELSTILHVKKVKKQ